MAASKDKTEMYREAMNPQRKLVSEDEFDQIIYDTVARDQSMSRHAVIRWAKKNFRIEGKEEN